MLRIRIVTILAVSVGALALAPAASAHHGCSKHAKGAQIVTKTKEAHVFIKRQHWYGCASKFGRVRLLPDLDSTEALRFGDGAVPDEFTLAGQFVAYEREVLYPAGAESQSRVYVFDLGTGKTEYSSIVTSTQPAGEDSVLYKLVLKRNGSAAWTARLGSGPNERFEVHRWSKYHSVGGRVTADFGPDVDPESLQLSADRLRISWTRGGQEQSTELP